jgi:type II secretory pathway pseudopilin PulG
MMRALSKNGNGRPNDHRGAGAFTLMEVVIAIGVAAVAIVATVEGYVFAAKQAEWSAYNLAAQSLAMQRLEQTRAAKWDTLSTPVVDELVSSNFPTVVDILDIPVNGEHLTGTVAAMFPATLASAPAIAAYAKTNGIKFVYATNHVSVWTLSTNPHLKAIQVECVWSFLNRGLFTNTVATYRSPDQ